LAAVRRLVPLEGIDVEASLGQGFVVEPVIDLFSLTTQGLSVGSLPDTEISSDAFLASAARNGNREAFGLLYHRYSRLVHGIMLARVPRSEVDDLVQDVFLLALRRVETLRDTTAFGAWLSMIARNRANDYHRRSPETVDLPEEIAGADSPRAEALAVLTVIRSLPDAYRETLVFRLVEGMTGPEIAVRTGLTPASVRVNLHRGMKLLRERLDRRGAHD
jgi:RNA polymerase sigma-70 factor, ECF subfamily